MASVAMDLHSLSPMNMAAYAQKFLLLAILLLGALPSHAQLACSDVFKKSKFDKSEVWVPPTVVKKSTAFAPILFSKIEAEQVLLGYLFESTNHRYQSMDQVWRDSNINTIVSRGISRYPGITALEALSVWMYTEKGYRIINKPLRAGNTLNRQQQVFASLVYSAVQKAPSARSEVLRKAAIPAELKSLYKKGNIIRYKAFLSTAQLYVSMAAMPHLKNSTEIYNFRIRHHGSAHAIENMSSQPLETEALFLPGSAFVIKEIKGKDILLEEVDPQTAKIDFEG